MTLRLRWTWMVASHQGPVHCLSGSAAPGRADGQPGHWVGSWVGGACCTRAALGRLQGVRNTGQAGPESRAPANVPSSSSPHHRARTGPRCLGCAGRPAPHSRPCPRRGHAVRDKPLRPSLGLFTYSGRLCPRLLTGSVPPARAWHLQAAGLPASRDESDTRPSHRSSPPQQSPLLLPPPPGARHCASCHLRDTQLLHGRGD